MKKGVKPEVSILGDGGGGEDTSYPEARLYVHCINNVFIIRQCKRF